MIRSILVVLWIDFLYKFLSLRLGRLPHLRRGTAKRVAATIRTHRIVGPPVFLATIYAAFVFIVFTHSFYRSSSSLNSSSEKIGALSGSANIRSAACIGDSPSRIPSASGASSNRPAWLLGGVKL